MAWLARRHRLGAGSGAAVAALDAGLSAIAQAATAPAPPEENAQTSA
jgi:hypothetical protein